MRFCNPGYIVNIVALLRENPDPTDEEILEYLSGNLWPLHGVSEPASFTQGII